MYTVATRTGRVIYRNTRSEDCKLALNCHMCNYRTRATWLNSRDKVVDSESEENEVQYGCPAVIDCRFTSLYGIPERVLNADRRRKATSTAGFSRRLSPSSRCAADSSPPTIRIVHSNVLEVAFGAPAESNVSIHWTTSSTSCKRRSLQLMTSRRYIQAVH